MSTHPDPRLPSYAQLRYKYVHTPATWAEIARHYKANRFTIWKRAREGARRHGDPWPLVKAVPLKIAGTGVSSALTRAEVLRFCGERDLTFSEFAALVGVHRQWLYNITSGRRKTISPAKVEQIIGFIMDVESGRRKVAA